MSEERASPAGGPLPPATATSESASLERVSATLASLAARFAERGPCPSDPYP